MGHPLLRPRTLHSALEVLAAPLPPQRILQRLAGLMARRLCCDHLSLLAFDAVRAEMEVVAVGQGARWLIREGTRFAVGRRFWHWITEGPYAGATGDSQAAMLESEPIGVALAKEGIHVSCEVPLWREAQTACLQGIVQIGRRDGERRFSSEEREVATELSACVAVALRMRDLEGPSRASSEPRDEELRRARRQGASALAELARAVAHDFNNVLHTVLQGAFLAREGATAEGRTALERVEEAAARGASCIRQLTEVAHWGQSVQDLASLSPDLLATGSAAGQEEPDEDSPARIGVVTEEEAPRARLLLVEDDDSSRETMSDLLEQAGYEVHAVSTVKVALAVFASESFDLVLSDLGLPDGTGWEVARAVKTDAPGMKVLLITGWGHLVTQGESRARGVDVVLSKPVSPAKLVSEIKGLLGR